MVSKKVWIAIIVVIALIAVVSVTSFYTGSFVTRTEAVDEPTTTLPIETGQYRVLAEKDNILTEDQPASNFFTYTYDCDWQGNTMKCSGEVQYIGQEGTEVSGAIMLIYCDSDKDKCLLEKDQQELGSMRKGDRVIYGLSCSFDRRRDIDIHLKITSGVPVFMLPVEC